jgi:hypothetical protein
MRIGKTSRQLLQVGLAAGTVSSVSIMMSRPLALPWRIVTWILAVPAYFLIWFALSVLASGLDDWLRRVTRDPLWLSTDEGRRWKRRQK